MPANLDPIYVRQPQIAQSGAVIGPSANTAQDGTGANITAIFQADATEGSFVQFVTLKAVGSPAATVARFFYHSTSGVFTPGTTNDATNTTLIGEMTLPAITVSQTASSPDYRMPINLGIPAGMRLLMTFGTSTGSAGTGYAATAFAGRY